jgi:uncharacterized tellurite resistance protein B-like protein
MVGVKTRLDPVTLALLAALGLELACVGKGGGEGAGEGPDTGNAETGTTSENTSANADESTDDHGDGDGNGDGDGDGDTGTPIPDVYERPVEPFECLDPQPILQADTDVPSGFVKCEGGFVHRVEAVECVDPAPAGTCDECLSACDAQPYGACTYVWEGDFDGCACRYGCATDADCGAGKICACAGVAGWHATCIPAACTDSASCGDGLCGLSKYDNGCGFEYELACAAADGCHTNDDCTDDVPCPNRASAYPGVCVAVGGTFQCTTPSDCFGVCGRPLFVDGEARVASVWARADWCEALEPGSVDAPTRARLVEHWISIAQFEHASVASFARFASHLMQLGAPPELLRDTQAAMLDELRHARLAFGLASAYAQRTIGPGALTGAIEAASLQAIVEGLVHEACVEETLAALEAREAAAWAEDPVLAQTLATIAADELRHAQLGWRSLRWILDEHPRLRAFALARLETAVEAAAREPATLGVSASSLQRHGVLDATSRAELRRAGVRAVIEPCVAALRERYEACDRANDRSVRGLS